MKRATFNISTPSGEKASLQVSMDHMALTVNGVLYPEETGYKMALNKIQKSLEALGCQVTVTSQDWDRPAKTESAEEP